MDGERSLSSCDHVRFRRERTRANAEAYDSMRLGHQYVQRENLSLPMVLAGFRSCCDSAESAMVVVQLLALGESTSGL